MRVWFALLLLAFAGCASEREFDSFKWQTESDRRWIVSDLNTLRLAVRELQRGYTVKVVTVTVTNEVHTVR